MKVAIYCPSIGLPGCPERTLREIVARSRHEWVIFTRRYEPELTFPDLRQAPILEVPRGRKLPLGGARALVVFSSGAADLANLRSYNVPVVALCFSPMRSAFDPEFQRRYLQRAGCGPLRSACLRAGAAAWRAVDRLLWKRYARVLAVSEEARGRVAEAGLRPLGSVQVLHPGVDTERLLPARTYSQEFVVPGRIAWHKNIELAIDAFRLLLERRPNLAHFRMTVAGAVESRSEGYGRELRARAAALPEVRFLEAPSQEKLLARCRAAYGIVLPQSSEGWSLLALEAMALRRPVIALNGGGCDEIVVHGQTGMVVEPTPEALATAMEFLADNPAMVRSMGASGRARAAHFEWRDFCTALDDAMEQVAGIPSDCGLACYDYQR